MQRSMLACVAMMLTACAPDQSEQVAATPAEAHALQKAHSAEFERKVYRVADGIYQAVGFGLANSMLVVGDGCDFVIDVMGSTEAAQAVRQEFARLSDQPIRALIYTHNHADHVFGGEGFGVPEAEVYAHETTNFYINRVVNILRPIIAARSARMFGTELPDSGQDAVINAGIGPYLEIRRDSGTVGLLRPTRTFSERLETEICGVEVVLQHAPGETDDQLFVWLPQRRALFPGDNIYKAFPNLYTIRGTPYRDVLKWVASLDAMRDLSPEHLVPSHTRYVSGAAKIDDVLTAYRDGIQFVHDQTVRGINAGLSADEIAATVALPQHLANHPYLLELYGTVEWSVRSIFTGYLGWFSGNAEALSPVTPVGRARRIASLAGGATALIDAARAANAEGDHAWAAELAGYALATGGGRAASTTQAEAFRSLAAQSVSPNGRHYYLTQALEREGSIDALADQALNERVASLVNSIPIGNFMAAMPTRLDPDRSIDVETIVGFRFQDATDYTLEVRRGVAIVTEGLTAERDITVTVDADVWRAILLGRRNFVAAVASGDVQVDGGRVKLATVLGLFRN